MGLHPILVRKPPYNLTELKFIDINLSGTLIELLMDLLISSESHLRTLALVNAPQTEKSFAKTVKYLEESGYVRDLDLSWSSIRPALWPKLLEAISDHVSLQFINLSHNRLMEEPKLTPKDVAKGLTEVPFAKLSKDNKKTLSLFAEMLEFNQNLKHLNL